MHYLLLFIITLSFPQTKIDFEKQQKEVQKEPKQNIPPVSNKAQVSV